MLKIARTVSTVNNLPFLPGMSKSLNLLSDLNKNEIKQKSPWVLLVSKCIFPITI